MREVGHSPALCARFHRASELIGRRWTGAIIFVLLKSRCRFAVLGAAIPDITDRMLSDRLRELEEEGIVERTVVPATPVRVEYALTKKGRALAAAILAGFGDLAVDGEWLTVTGVDRSRIPDVVAAIVAAGGRVHAVDPGRATLEDRYFELITGRAEATGQETGEAPA